MDPLQELLEALAADGAVAALSDEELAGALETLREGTAGIDVDNPSADDVELLGRIADTVESLDGEQTRRTEEATTRASEARDRLARIRGEQAEGEEGDEAEGERAAATEGEQAEAEGTEQAEQPQAVAAAGQAATPPTRRPSISSLIRHREPQSAPRTSTGERLRLRSITAAAGFKGRNSGDEINDAELAEEIVRRARNLRGKGVSAYEPIHVGSMRLQFPESRQLSDRDAQANGAKLDAVMGPAAITAAGGLCAPLAIDYDVPTIAADDRPLRDTGATPTFGAPGGMNRGGVRWMTSPALGDFAEGITAWTVANDEAAGDGDPVKPCVRIDCGTEKTIELEALPVCLTVGNFFNMTYREMVEAVLRVMRSEAARFAEKRHLAAMATAGNGVRVYTANELLGSTRNLLAVLDRADAAYREIFRTSDALRFRIVLPRWLRRNIATDLAREMPGASVDRLMENDETLPRLLRNRGLNATFTWDGPVSQSFSYLASGNTFMGWPDVAGIDFYPEGTWAQITAPDLDLGIVRDSTLNEANDLQIWSESFEQVFLRGPGDSWHINVDLCADGSTSAAVDIDPCTTGS